MVIINIDWNSKASYDSMSYYNPYKKYNTIQKLVEHEFVDSTQFGRPVL